MVEPKLDYGHIAEKLAIAIEQAMWSGDEFDQQAHELCVFEDALKHASAKLWADGEAAKDRATFLNCQRRTSATPKIREPRSSALSLCE